MDFKYNNAIPMILETTSPTQPTRFEQVRGKLENAGVDILKHFALYEWLLDAMVSEYKQGMADASKIYKEVYKLEG